MKKLAAVGVIFTMLCGCISAVHASPGEVLFHMGETIQGYDKVTGEVLNGEFPSGTKIGSETGKATWGTSNGDKLTASVTADEPGAEGDAFKIHYTAKVGGDTQEFIRFDSVSAELNSITPENPLVIAYRVKAVFENTASMNAWIDVVPVLKPETGATVEKDAFIQQSLNAENNGKWTDVKYVITGVTDENQDGKAELHFERYLDGVLSKLPANSSPLVLADGTADMKLVGLKIRPRARATDYQPGGFMDIIFDSIRLYRAGSKWGDDFVVGGVHNYENLPAKTVIGDRNSFAAYTLSSNSETYVNRITENGNMFSATNQSGKDNYQHGLLPTAARTYTAEDLNGNRTLVYEMRYKIEYQPNDAGNTSYSAVQMLVELYRNDSQSLQFFIPANTKKSGEWLTVKIAVPQGTIKGETQPVLYVDDQPVEFSGNLEGIDKIKIKRIMFANRVRSGQTMGEKESEAVFTVDFLDEYILQEDGELKITADTLTDGAAGIPVDSEKISFTANHLLDPNGLGVKLFKDSGNGNFEEVLQENTYTVCSGGNRGFDLVLTQPLEEETQYRIDLSGVKDLYGNTAAGTYTFTTAKKFEWKQVKWDSSTGCLETSVSNHTGTESKGKVYAAAIENDRVVCAEVQQLDVQPGQEGVCSFQLQDVGADAEIRLFYWDENMCPILKDICAEVK